MMEAKKRSEDILEVVERLRNNDPELTEVDVSFMELSDAEAQLICIATENSRHVRSLNFSNNNITDDGAKNMYKVLKEHRTVNSVNLGGNTKISVNTLGMINLGLSHKPKHLLEPKLVIPVETEEDKARFSIAKMSLFNEFKECLKFCETFDGSIENMTRESFFTLTKQTLSSLEKLRSLDTDTRSSSLSSENDIKDFTKALSKILKKPWVLQNPKVGTIYHILHQCTSPDPETAYSGQLKLGMLLFSFRTAQLKVDKMLELNKGIDRAEDQSLLKSLGSLKAHLAAAEEALMMATRLEKTKKKPPIVNIIVRRGSEDKS